MKLFEIVDHADRLLEVGRFQDYCPNGLQVQGRGDVRRIASGVTACRELIEAAIADGADMLLVHHGYFWKGEDARIIGYKRRRIQLLLDNDLSLVAYHLPLDVHPELGNNAGLASALGWEIMGTLGPDSMGLHGVTPQPQNTGEFVAALAQVLGRVPQHVPGGPAVIRHVGWCTGAAQDLIEPAANLGLDAFVSGEISERTVHVAREAGIHYFAAGHHATERFGPMSLGTYLATHFGLEHRFFDIGNPV